MGPGVFLGVCLATVCGLLSFKSSAFSGFQVVVSFLVVLSFLGPISISSLFTEIEQSSKWLLFGMISLVFFGTSTIGLIFFTLCGVFVWLVTGQQGLFVLSSFKIIRDPMPI